VEYWSFWSMIDWIYISEDEFAVSHPMVNYGWSYLVLN
jgi:hypothetical protein